LHGSENVTVKGDKNNVFESNILNIFSGQTNRTREE
jgi:hypothetical protein